MAGKKSLKVTFNQILNNEVFERSSDTKELYIIIDLYRKHSSKYAIELAKK